MDEVEGVVLGIDMGDDADMVDTLAAATEEDEVAGLQGIAPDGFALRVLLL